MRIPHLYLLIPFCCSLIPQLAQSQGAPPSFNSFSRDYNLNYNRKAEPSLPQKLMYRVDADRSALAQSLDLSFSSKDMDRMQHFYEEALKQVRKVPMGKQTTAGKVDLLLICDRIEAAIDALNDRRMIYEADKGYYPFSDDIIDLVKKRRKLEELVEQDVAAQLDDIIKSVKEGRKALEADWEKGQKKKDESAEKSDNKEADKTQDETPKPFPKWRAVRISSDIGNLKNQLDKWYKHYAVYRPGFEWWMKATYEDARKQLEEYEKWTREKVAEKNENSLIGRPIGEKRLNEMIRHEIIPYDARELLKIGEAEYDWCLKEMKKASKELGKKDWHAGLEYVKDQFVPPGEQDELVAQYAREAADFVIERDLLTVPKLCREAWTVNMVEEKRQKTMPYALYSGNKVIVAYAGSGMGHEQKLMSMRANNLHATRLVVPHEVIPGHHLQMFYAQRYRPDRRMFRTPFHVEGWALYWETRLWDLEWQRNPEDRIGMLFWRMHRCARIIVTMKFHLGEMTPDEMVQFLIDDVGHEDEQAQAEVRRYITTGYSPLYQAAYMIGGQQFRSLHAELVQEAGWSEKKFHDSILKLGTMPVEMIRAELTNQKLDWNFKTNWKFYKGL